MIANRLFNECFLEAYNICPFSDLAIEHVDPSSFLSSSRFDLAFKLYYIHCKITNTHFEEAKRAYIEHIRCFSNGTFCEPGDANKTSIIDYLSTFDKLIDKISKTGFDDAFPVPVGTDNNIVNGSHRTAIAIYYGLKLPIVRIKKEAKYDYDFFKKRGMKQNYLDFGAFLFAFFSKDSFIAIVWPRAKSSLAYNNAIAYLEKNNNIAYKKDIKLTKLGLDQLIKVVYGKQTWTGSIDNQYKQSVEKSEKCYDRKNLISIYLISNSNINDVTSFKSEFRLFLGLGNHSLHISDSRLENLLIGSSLLNKNSIRLLNNYNVFKNDRFLSHLVDYGWGDKTLLENLLFCPPLFEKGEFSWDDVAFVFGRKVILKEFKKEKTHSSELAHILKTRTKSNFKKRIKKTFSHFLKPLVFVRNVLFYKNWKSVSELFLKLNKYNLNYVIISHWIYFTDNIDFSKNDIDILFSSKSELEIFLRMSKYCKKQNGSYLLLIKNKYVSFDVCTSDECLYGKKWSEKLLLNKVYLRSSFFGMSKEDFLYTLLFKIFVHNKRSLNYVDFIKLKSVDCPLEVFNSPKKSLSDFLNKLNS